MPTWDGFAAWWTCVAGAASDSCGWLGGGWGVAALIAIAGVAALAVQRLVMAARTLRAVALAPRLARMLSRWVRLQSYSDEAFFRADGADPSRAEERRSALARLEARLGAAHPRSKACGDAIREGLSDLRFTDANRVPAPFARVMRERFDLCSVVTESRGPWLRDLDDHWTLDVSGSYGLNVAGYGRYREWMTKGLERVAPLGPVLGPLHPIVAENIAILREVSRLDEVSFHMSGTEAVMAAVRLARFNTRRKLIVCFSGAYHGWWDGVQTGLGSERDIDDCLTLKDLHPASLDLIRRRAGEIVGVLVNPMQSFHPNMPPPNDAILLTSGMRKTEESSEAYGRWLRSLRAVCDEAGVPLIFDEVYTGFRLAPGGGQAYFGVQADMVIYGKTVGGGMPIGVVCGRRELMRRFDPDRPMRLAYVVGTFSAHPVVMGAMNEFLRWVREPATAEAYAAMDERCGAWALSTNRALAGAALPLRIVRLGTVWTILFTEPGRYNWLLQYYLRAEGVTMSWVGTGRCLASMDVTVDDYDALRVRILDAGRQMQADGWWIPADAHGREWRMRQGLVKELVGSLVRVPEPIRAFHAEIMRRKHDDHHASHSNVINQLFHIVSSSAFLVCYGLVFWDLTTAMWAGAAALLLRQFGHAVLEPPCHDKEETLLGYNTRNKTIILGAYVLIPLAYAAQASAWTLDGFRPLLAPIAQALFLWTALVIGGRVIYLAGAQGAYLALVWLVKLVTDPITDLIAYTPRYLVSPGARGDRDGT